MKRPAPWLLLALAGAVVGVAFALGQDGSVLRLPEDLKPCATPVQRRDGRAPLADGSSRSVQTWDHGYGYGGASLVRGEESVELPIPWNGVTLLGATGGAATLLKSSLPVSPTTRRLDFVRYGIAENEAPRQAFAIDLPEGFLTVNDLLLSPDGKSLAWSVFVRRERPGIAWLRKRFPALVRNVAPRYAHELWRSDADGGRFQPVASAPQGPQKTVLRVGWDTAGGKIVAVWNGAPLATP